MSAGETMVVSYMCGPLLLFCRCRVSAGVAPVSWAASGPAWLSYFVAEDARANGRPLLCANSAVPQTSAVMCSCVFRSTLVVDELEEARSLCYGSDRHKVVTVEGTLFKPNGTITGEHVCWARYRMSDYQLLLFLVAQDASYTVPVCQECSGWH